MTDFTTFLFAQPSFFEGFARIADIGGTLNEYNSSLDRAQADRLAFKADILAVRRDIQEARKKLRAELMNVGAE